MSECQCSDGPRGGLGLTVSCLHYLFSSAPECEGCALSPDAPAPPGSQLLPINDSGVQTQEELQSSDAPTPHTAVAKSSRTRLEMFIHWEEEEHIDKPKARSNPVR